MIQINAPSLSADEFIAQYGDQDHYELIDGALVDLEPTGLHEQVIAFIAAIHRTTHRRENHLSQSDPASSTIVSAFYRFPCPAIKLLNIPF